MADMKLGKLPDRTPVKHTITVKPDLNRRLEEYAAMYNEQHSASDPEELEELIPYMLDAFLDSDRAFTRRMKQQKKGGEVVASPKSAEAPRKRAGGTLTSVS